MERIARSAPRSWLRAGSRPSFSASARYLALVPKTVTRSRSAMSHRMVGGASGAPSNNTTVAPTASEDTTQFHIIQPQVVK